jgi:hypothetical protein
VNTYLSCSITIVPIVVKGILMQVHFSLSVSAFYFVNRVKHVHGAASQVLTLGNIAKNA